MSNRQLAFKKVPFKIKIYLLNRLLNFMPFGWLNSKTMTHKKTYSENKMTKIKQYTRNRLTPLVYKHIKRKINSTKFHLEFLPYATKTIASSSRLNYGSSK